MIQPELCSTLTSAHFYINFFLPPDEMFFSSINAEFLHVCLKRFDMTRPFVFIRIIHDTMSPKDPTPTTQWAMIVQRIFHQLQNVSLLAWFMILYFLTIKERFKRIWKLKKTPRKFLVTTKCFFPQWKILKFLNMLPDFG